MYKGSKPRIAPIIIVIIIIALIIAGGITLIRSITMGKDDANDEEQGNSVTSLTLDQDSGRSVRWTVRGPLVAQENFRTYRITISPSKREYVLYSGYLDSVIDTKTYDNNVRAYEEFIYALNNANIGLVRESDASDFRGVCATQGIAYMYETLNQSIADSTLWSTTCKESRGTLGADPLKIQALFVNQLPEFTPSFNSIF